MDAATVLSRRHHHFAVHLVRLGRARRYIMRLRPDGALRVTIPRGGSAAEALRFAERHLDWAIGQRARWSVRHAVPAVWQAGTDVLLDGVPTPIVRLGDDRLATFTAGRLIVHLPEGGHLREAFECRLREVARAELADELGVLAAAHGIAIGRVTIRNQRTRWGSCSPRGDIALNYRLIQVPPSVREYVLLHELMHVRELNHSRRFWRLVESVCPSFRESERWLKQEGRRLFD